MHPEIEHLRGLPIGEKLRLVEDLWDDIAASPEPFPLPSWHREEAQRRAAELQANPALALTREELWRRVQQNHG